MLPDTERLLRDRGSELVFGLVAPVGADLSWLEDKLATLLRLYGYTPQHVRLSELLKKLPDIAEDLKDSPEVDRINTFMDGGNKLRDRAKTGEILALWAISEIYQRRNAINVSSPDRAFRTAYILRSIKHPDEARALRAVYGSSVSELIEVSDGQDQNQA